ncbi:hypothetical protein GUITHDRAFT_163172 [Guillardia theta CCMP2712]|uniref:RNA-editing substrate-binding complex 6 protein domain-containing protein n=1 Tax=Guillardia theta (strain CCMP2712) TaxID=905079 RepID=L1JBN3_GUITC|nr:hypothetical protein GUITHDRAFT_163172 [Guillardia theta CCMP2712]EKX45921.1 hypothetical protein GUITHDRAFT_163172 [Guillardia theta CCMP2712]|eukprot:XP_005832901.1 hypothetical protein GUITHDRAFT_163172 [Guillardia theta CCMP2712]
MFRLAVPRRVVMYFLLLLVVLEMCQDATAFLPLYHPLRPLRNFFPTSPPLLFPPPTQRVAISPRMPTLEAPAIRWVVMSQSENEREGGGEKASEKKKRSNFHPQQQKWSNDPSSAMRTQASRGRGSGLRSTNQQVNEKSSWRRRGNMAQEGASPYQRRGNSTWDRGNRGSKNNKMMPQIRLNARLTQCVRAEQVLGNVSEAVEGGVALNSVNIATAIHRVAKTGNERIFRQLSNSEPYGVLVRLLGEKLAEEIVNGSSESDMTSRELANSAWGLAKAQFADLKTFQLLHRGSVAKGLESFKAQELSNLAWSFATIWNLCSQEERLRYESTVKLFFVDIEKELMSRARPIFERFSEWDQANAAAAAAAASSQLVKGSAGQKTRSDSTGQEEEQVPGLQEFKPQEVSNILWSYATVGFSSPTVFKLLAFEILRRGLREFVPQDVANSVWAYVTVGQSTKELLHVVESDAERRGLSAFKNQELANLIWAFAKADYPMDLLLRLVEQDIASRDLSLFMPQELSNLVWAFATAGHRSEHLFLKIASEISSRGLADFKPQEIANTAWAYAKIGVQDEKLFHRIEMELILHRSLRPFIPQELSNILWSFAKFNIASDKLFQVIGQEMLVRGLQGFKPQELSNTVWAHASNGLTFPFLFGEVEREAVRRGLRLFSPQDISNMLWAFAKADHVAPSLYEQLRANLEELRVADPGLTMFKAQELSNLLWAAAKTQHTARCLFSAAEEQVKQILKYAESREERDETCAVVPLEVTDDMWRFASVGQTAEELFATLEEQVLTRDLMTFTTLHLANIAWAIVFLRFSRFNRFSESGNRLLQALMKASEARLEEFSIEELRQLGQVILATFNHDERRTGFSLRVLEALKNLHANIETPVSSDFHLQVSETFKRLNVPIFNEVKFWEGVYHIDIVVGEATFTGGVPCTLHPLLSLGPPADMGGEDRVYQRETERGWLEPRAEPIVAVGEQL